MLGRTLNRYRIESTIGRGGMGVVYKARDSSLDRYVAVKELAADAVADPTRKRRFALEAKAASALNHPGIVTVHDVSADGDTDFIVMEWVDGRTLDEVIGAKGVGVTTALRYGVAMADALATAHAAGIVHRDLKPSNVMVTRDDRVKILDFGLAKLVEPSSSTDLEPTRTGPLTEAGIVLGTVAYMAPEQARGEAIDARTDIFSFGAVLYQMVTGRTPFAADSRVATLAKILDEDPPPPSTFVPVAPEIERAILRCLRKDPARRYQTMADLKVALEDLSADPASGALSRAPAGAPARRGWMWAAVGGAILAAAAAGVIWWSPPTPPPATALRAVPLASLPGVTRSPSFSSDGNQIAFNWNGPDGANQDIYVQQIGAGAPLRLTSNPASDYSPQWSPDGRWIAFLRGEGDGGRHELRLVPPLSGPERRVAEIRPRGFLRPITLARCPDATCVVVTDSSAAGKPDALFVVSLDTGEKRQLTTPAETILADTDPAISPDGKWLAFRRDHAPFSGEVHLAALNPNMTAAGESRRVVDGTFYPESPQWLADSTAIVFSAKAALWRLAIVDGAAAPERLPFVGEDGLTPVVSTRRADGTSRLAYIRSYTDTNIWKAEMPAPGMPASRPPVLAVSSTRGDILPNVSPDGRHVTFCSTRSGESEIWRAELSGANAVQLTHMGLNPGWPRWSSDGQMVAFHSNGVAGRGDIFVVPAEGGAPRNLTSMPANDALVTFSRDGSSIYFYSARQGEDAIWKMPLTGGPAVRVTPGPGRMAIESPDGTSLYYTEGQLTNAPSTLWRLPLAGGPPVKLAANVISTSFDVVAGGVYYVERLATAARLQYFDQSSNRSITIVDNLGNVQPGGLSASADGRTVLFTRIDTSVNDIMLVDGFR